MLRCWWAAGDLVGDQIMDAALQTTRRWKDARRAFIVTRAGDAIWM